jgi:prepilin-type processing-associated H-X9-DG protein
MMMPYFEATNGYNAFNTIHSYDFIGNLTATSTQVTALICPDDNGWTQNPAGEATWVQGSYGMSFGRNEVLAFNWINGPGSPPSSAYPYASTCNQGGADGMFDWGASVKIASVTDGLSNTFLFGEMSRYPGEPASPFNIANTAGYFGDDYPNPYGRPTAGAYVVPKLNAPPDTTGNIAAQCWATAVLPPDWIAVPACLNWGQFGFRSQHPAGANFGFADGSVKFIKNQINVPTYRALGTRALGEVVSADQY